MHCFFLPAVHIFTAKAKSKLEEGAVCHGAGQCRSGFDCSSAEKTGKKTQTSDEEEGEPKDGGNTWGIIEDRKTLVIKERYSPMQKGLIVGLLFCHYLWKNILTRRFLSFQVSSMAGRWWAQAQGAMTQWVAFPPLLPANTQVPHTVLHLWVLKFESSFVIILLNHKFHLLIVSVAYPNCVFFHFGQMRVPSSPNQSANPPTPWEAEPVVEESGTVEDANVENLYLMGRYFGVNHCARCLITQCLPKQLIQNMIFNSDTNKFLVWAMLLISHQGWSCLRKRCRSGNRRWIFAIRPSQRPATTALLLRGQLVEILLW